MSHIEQPSIVQPTVESDRVLGTETWAQNHSASDKYQLQPSSTSASSRLQNLNAFSGNKKLSISCYPQLLIKPPILSTAIYPNNMVIYPQPVRPYSLTGIYST